MLHVAANGIFKSRFAATDADADACIFTQLPFNALALKQKTATKNKPENKKKLPLPVASCMPKKNLPTATHMGRLIEQLVL